MFAKRLIQINVVFSYTVYVNMPLGKEYRAARNHVIAVVRQHLHVKKLLAQESFKGQHQQSSAVKSCGDWQVATGAGLCSLGALSDKPARRRQVCDCRLLEEAVEYLVCCTCD